MVDGSRRNHGRLAAGGFYRHGELPSAFAVTDFATGAVGVAAAAIAELIAKRCDARSQVRVDQRLASMWFGFSIRRKGGELPPAWDAVAGDYATKDGWIRLHTNAPHIARSRWRSCMRLKTKRPSRRRCHTGVPKNSRMRSCSSADAPPQCVRSMSGARIRRALRSQRNRSCTSTSSLAIRSQRGRPMRRGRSRAFGCSTLHAFWPVRWRRVSWPIRRRRAAHRSAGLGRTESRARSDAWETVREARSAHSVPASPHSRSCSPQLTCSSMVIGRRTREPGP